MRLVIGLLLLGIGLASYDWFLDRDDVLTPPTTEVTAAEDGTGFPPPKP